MWLAYMLEPGLSPCTLKNTSCSPEGMVKITIRQNGGSVTLSLRSNEITTAQVLW